MTYLDHAATSYPKPQAVRRALSEALTDFGGNPGRGGHRLSIATAEMVYDCRVELAELFGVSAPERIIFTAGATMALNLAILTRVRRGMHILISDREHNAVLRPILRLAREGIAEYDIYPTGGDVISAITERIRPSTAIVVACHVSNVSGFTLPLPRIADLCKERGLSLIVDAAQSAGHIPIDLEKIPCDAFCAPAHKGLLGIAGCGFAILDRAEGLPPFLSGGSGTNSLSHDMPEELPERYEAGTLPTAAIAALRAGVRYVRDLGIEQIAAAENALRSRILEGLSVLPRICLYEPDCQGGLIAFNHRDIPPEQLARLLDERGICVRAGYHCAPLAHRTLATPGGCVRISIGCGNLPSDGDRFLGAMSDILRKK